MSYYRKLQSGIWNEGRFSDLSCDGKLLFFFLLTHPHMTALGAMRATVAGFASELNWSVERLEGALSEASLKTQVLWDEKKPMVWLRDFLKDNPPESPNVVKSWESALSYLPDGSLKDQLIRETHALVLGLPVSFQEALPPKFQPQAGWERPAVRGLGETLITVESQASPLLDPPTERPVVRGLGETLITVESISLTPFGKTCLNTNNKYQIANNKNQILNTKEENPKTKESISVEFTIEEKGDIGEITTIVAPTRPKTSKPPDADVREVFECWQQTLGHPHAVLEVKRRKRIRDALRSGYTPIQLCEAIRGCSQTPHNMGENEQGQRYDGLHVILRDADQIDRFIHNAHNPPRRRTKADQLLADNLAAGDRWLAKHQEMEREIYEADGS